MASISTPMLHPLPLPQPLPPQLTALLLPLRDHVSLRMARSRSSRSLRTRFAWINVRVPCDSDSGATAAHSLEPLRDALALLVALLQLTDGSKREWAAVYSCLLIRDDDAVWGEMTEHGELRVRVRLEIKGNELHDDLHFPMLRILLGLDTHDQTTAFQGTMRVVRQYTTRPYLMKAKAPRVPLSVVLAVPRDALERGVEFAANYLAAALRVVCGVTYDNSVWELHDLELAYEHIELDERSRGLLEQLCLAVPTVSSLRVRVPSSWTKEAVADFLRRLDESDRVLALTLCFESETQLPTLVDAIRSLSRVHCVALERVSSPRRLHDRATDDVDLTGFFQPSTEAPLVPTLRCDAWTLNPVQVVTWFWSPLVPEATSRITSLDLELDFMRLVTLQAALNFIGTSLQTLVLRASDASNASTRDPVLLPLDAFLVDCPQLNFLEVHGFRVDSLRGVAASTTPLRSLSFRGTRFDDGLTPGLMAIVDALTTHESQLKEFHVDPVPVFCDSELGAITRMLDTNQTLELFVLQQDGKIPSALWQRFRPLHLRSPPMLYAFLSVVHYDKDSDRDTAIRRLSRDALMTIFALVGRPVRRKLCQRL